MSQLTLFVFYLSIILSPAEAEPFKADVCLNAEEQKLFKIINQYRRSKKLKAIPYSASLTLVAQLHAKDLADHYNFDPKGKCNPHSWSENGEWGACCYTNDHKQAKCMWDKPMEIAGYNSPGYEIAYFSSAGASADEGLSGWKKSPSHNPLIINEGMWEQAEWQAMGVGIYKEYAVVWFGQLDDSSTLRSCQNRN